MHAEHPTGYPYLIGPYTFLRLSRGLEPEQLPALLETLTPAYAEIVRSLQESGAAYVHIDEPAFAMDVPDARRVHQEPTPRWGGLAIYIGVAVGMLAGLARLYLLAPSDTVFLERALQFLGLLMIGTSVLIVGMLDDLKQFSALIQMGALLLAGLLVQLFGVQIEGFAAPIGGKFS
ncbi:MAG: hypothetical protein ACK4RG_10470, partial [Fimbriimonadales bacterium]